MKKNIYCRIHPPILWVIVATLIAACSGTEARSAYEQKIPADIGDGWEAASLRDAGLDSRKIAVMMKDIQDGGFDNLHSLLIVKDGRLVFEEYFRGQNQSSIHFVASVTKSVTSILIGMAIDRGLIEGPDQTLTELLPSYAGVLNADPLKQKLQLWHILTMTSGIEWDEETYPYGDSRNDATAMERSANPVQFILDRPVIRQPGRKFQYSGANSMLLSAILQEVTGMNAADFAKQYLFVPLGISQYRWGTYPDGHTNTDGGLYLRPRDMAKIGLLMLNKGQWNGAQIVSPEWVAISTQAHTPVMPSIQYGYQWWRENQAIYLETVKTYFASGFGGQLIGVYPDQNMIVITTSDASSNAENISRFIFLRNKYILPATNPALLSKTLLWSWYILTISGLVYLVLDIIKGHINGFGWSVYWLLIGALFGPLGLAAYYFSYRKQEPLKASGWKALGISAFFATGNITTVVLLAALQKLFLPQGSLVLLVIPVTILVSWLVFIAPLITSARGIRYWKAARQTLLTAFISSCIVLAGIFPVLILLSFRWPEVDLASPLFWIMMTACGIAGAVVVYPFSFWLAHRNIVIWRMNNENKKSFA
jgi:CubicO group peptidase (beta-lactamase class C family)